MNSIWESKLLWVAICAVGGGAAAFVGFALVCAVLAISGSTMQGIVLIGTIVGALVGAGWAASD